MHVQCCEKYIWPHRDFFSFCVSHTVSDLQTKSKIKQRKPEQTLNADFKWLLYLLKQNMWCTRPVGKSICPFSYYIQKTNKVHWSVWEGLHFSSKSTSDNSSRKSQASLISSKGQLSWPHYLIDTGWKWHPWESGEPKNTANPEN